MCQISMKRFIKDFNNSFKNHMAFNNLDSESLLPERILLTQELQQKHIMYV